ncbi:F-box domain-containing protein [Trichoderma simmonsii]|uniref:F-box domain-containing protein n=1 Tax=Trichoderma simmonsii TaxID=1491479 RepID=A0A8G0LFZ3_9HYPO|nr:F-box domain-containing protein [Trichoderma simmonsii]
MDNVRQGHVVDASLAYLQRLEDEMRVLNGTQLVSSDSSTLGSPSARKRRRLESSSEGEGKTSKKTRIISASQHSVDVVFGPAEPPRHDRSRQLPAELWHHIFSFLSPVTLGRCLRVNRLFHKYLDPVSPFISTSVIHVPTTRILPTLPPDAIWRASRCLHWPAMPAPLKGKFELDMWRFACIRFCQFCGQLDKTYNTTEDSSKPRRPGNTTVSPIFPFFINSCGNCLVGRSIKELDFYVSTSRPSLISSGLPMVFLTPDMNVISPQELRSIPGAITPLQLTKVYWPAQVERLQEEFEEVKRFGVAATEEWRKGLETRGIEQIHDASRWDRWLLSGGVRQMRRHSTQPTANKPEIAKTLQKQRQDVETTVRIHISNLADEVIDRWVKGRSVKKGNCADFAVEVLAYVRKQFYKDGARAVSLTRGLTLDDMRWIFDHKVGPHTNHHEKDFFRCRECPGSRKRYGLQAILQHYAMKHRTKKLKSMTMLWRTEWPEEPPFRSSTSVSSNPTNHVEERREHAPYTIEAPASVMASQREQSHHVSSYQQPMPTTFYQSYDIVDVRNLPNGYYIQYPVFHDYRIPSNSSYSSYTIRESHNNTGALSQVYNVYESRDPLANRRSGGWE